MISHRRRGLLCLLPVSCCCPSCLSSSIPLGESVSCSFSPVLPQDFPSVSALSILWDLLSFWPVFCSWIRTRDPLSVFKSWHKISRQILLQSSGMVSGSCFYLRQSASLSWSRISRQILLQSFLPVLRTRSLRTLCPSSCSLFPCVLLLSVSLACLPVLCSLNRLRDVFSLSR